MCDGMNDIDLTRFFRLFVGFGSWRFTLRTTTKHPSLLDDDGFFLDIDSLIDRPRLDSGNGNGNGNDNGNNNGNGNNETKVNV